MGSTKTKAGIMITLGHNSSALYYDGVNKPIGYEEERLNGEKSSSKFPRRAIEQILNEIDTDELMGGKVFISHWFDVYDPKLFPAKYYDYDFMQDFVAKYNLEVGVLSKHFSHHDAHAYSSLAFFEYSLRNTSVNHSIEGDVHFIVADGFGNEKEVVSIYKQDPKSTQDLILVDRYVGYNKSIGLMYQYATAFCNMKENQDEYKFLGYESRIRDILKREESIKLLDDLSDDFSYEYGTMLMKQRTYEKTYEGSLYLDKLDLDHTRDRFYNVFNNVILKMVGSEGQIPLEEGSDYLRVIIGYFIQSCVEKVFSYIIDTYNIENVVLSGGSFYNVKLNNSILKAVPGIVCVIPVAGDQGAAIGMYQREFGYFDFSDLCYGKRRILNPGVQHGRITFHDDKEDFVDHVVSLLERDNIVNIVHGGMEFGPRALCNTSTLALPTKENVIAINEMNDRNTVMPMAPVILQRNVKAIFDNEEQVSRVVGSNEYMIMTHDVSDEAADSVKYRGIMHVYPDKTTYSGRPQIVVGQKSVIAKILNRVSSLCLINTSFNTHGTPILYSVDDCIRDFKKQCEHDKGRRNHLIFLEND
jgi:carbamoyltransferase